MNKEDFYTPHINASPDDFASTLLMPGDPKRAKFIAENFLEGARLINDVRGIGGYTGTYGGVRISVMASGMGMPSIGIYSYELFNFFGVKNIIRVGSAGSLSENVKVRDIIIGMSASTNSAYAEQFGLSGTVAPTADYTLMKYAIDSASEMGASYHVGNLLSSDVFYNADNNFNEKWARMGALGVEMEAAALYLNAAYSKKRALAICTVSDEIFTGASLAAAERERSFTEMIEIALNVAKRMEE